MESANISREELKKLILYVIKENNVDIEFYTARERDVNEILPWDHLDAGVTKQFLINEWEKAKNATVTPNCRMNCSGCGSAVYGGGVCFEAKN